MTQNVMLNSSSTYIIFWRLEECLLSILSSILPRRLCSFDLVASDWEYLRRN